MFVLSTGRLTGMLDKGPDIVIFDDAHTVLPPYLDIMLRSHFIRVAVVVGDGAKVCVCVCVWV